MKAQLDASGVAIVPGLLTAAQCAALRKLYDDRDRFRSRVVMERHNFGRGEYQYFAEPLPKVVQSLRTRMYALLAPVANAWADALGETRRFPDTLDGFRARCRDVGQTKPTPLLLKYGPGDYNCLHQDLYGELSFPLQLVVLLSEPGKDFEGGELVVVEQRPRMQSRAQVVPLQQGDGAIFAVHHRPAMGKRGPYRVNLRHGASTIRRGERFALGVIFHDAR